MIIANGLAACSQLKDKQGFDDSLSKVVALNGNHRLFFKTMVQADGSVSIVAAAVPGRSCGFEETGATWITLGDGQLEVDDMGKYKDVSGLQPWGRIASIIHDARAEREKKNKEREAQQLAEEQGTPIDQVQLQKSLDAIEEKYHGGKSASGKNIPPDVSPMLSGLQIKIVTQCLVVKLDASGNPDWGNAKTAAIELSNAKKNKLLELLKDPAAFNAENGYLEVGYKYIGASTKEAGQAASFDPIAESVSLKVQFPELWVQQGDAKVKGLASDGMQVVARNRNLSSNKGPKDIIAAIKKWCATNPACLTTLNLTSDDVKRQAKNLVEFGLVDAVPKVKGSLMEIIREQESETAEADTAHDDMVAQAAQNLQSVSGQDTSSLQALAESVGTDLDDLSVTPLD